MVRVLACPGRQESILRLLPRRHDHVPPCLGAVFHRRATPQGVPWQRYGPPHRPWVTPRARNLATTLEDQGRSLRFLVRDRNDTCLLGPSTRYYVRLAPVISTPVRAPRRTRSRKDLCAQHELSAWTGRSSGEQRVPVPGRGAPPRRGELLRVPLGGPRSSKVPPLSPARGVGLACSYRFGATVPPATRPAGSSLPAPPRARRSMAVRAISSAGTFT